MSVVMKPLLCSGRNSKRAVTSNGYGDCPDLARLKAGRVGSGQVLGLVGSRPGAQHEVAEPGLRSSTGLGYLCDAVRGREVLVVPPPGLGR